MRFNPRKTLYREVSFEEEITNNSCPKMKNTGATTVQLIMNVILDGLLELVSLVTVQFKLFYPVSNSSVNGIIGSGRLCHISVLWKIKAELLTNLSYQTLG
ncbi:hypothetical protein [Shimazuella alba]|uniref:Uncharacterized protein n=1 Tax=Shimazuella alba TaxID=2690964 RepID=A0A6I4VQZ6_9BACL|nr:hypothetical protein [Shimazuella alba]MXQ52818.1 hypothetical protein [Shimazuella alba]